jgi:hypothetical protein
MDFNHLITSIDIPKEFFKMDHLFIELSSYSESMEECELEFYNLYDEIQEKFATPFLRLHLVRSITSRLFMLSKIHESPLEYCLKRYQERINHEYGIYEVSIKTSEAILLAQYAKKCGMPDIANYLAEKISRDLNDLRSQCEICLERIRCEI